MPLQTIESNLVGTGIQVSLASEDDLLVKAGVLIQATDNSSAISSYGLENQLLIKGQVLSNGYCLDLGFPDGGAMDIQTELGKSSVVRSEGDVAIALWGGEHSIEMHGEVFSPGYALYLANGDGSKSFITNTGTVSAGDTGLLLTTRDKVTVKNTGMIESDQAGIWVQGTSGSVRIVNEGTIKGDTTGITNIGTGALHIENSGVIRLGVVLGDRADTYDGAQGRITGDIVGGDGDDTIIGGRRAERIIGGDGADRLTGGRGGDAFIFESDDESGTSARSRDKITDFSHASGDTIDLSDLTILGLDFVGKSAFSDDDQVRYRIVGDKTFVDVNLDSDAKADMTIEFTGKIKFVAADFAL